MDEQQFMVDDGVLVTSTRIVLNGKTFATRNVGSVAVEEGQPGALPVVLGLAGIVALMNGVLVWGLGLLVLSVGIAAARMRKRTIKLMAGGGEQVVYETHDAALADRLRAAIIQAIAVR